MLKTEGAVDVPLDEGHELVDRLLDMPQLPRVELPQELRLTEVSAKPVPHLTLHTPRGIRWQARTIAGRSAGFEYEGTIIRSSSPQVHAIVQPRTGPLHHACDRSCEETSWNDLIGLGARRLLNVFHGRSDAEIPAKSAKLGQVVRGLFAM